VVVGDGSCEQPSSQLGQSAWAGLRAAAQYYPATILYKMLSLIINLANRPPAAAAPCLTLAGAVAAQVAPPGQPAHLLPLDCTALSYRGTLGVCHHLSPLLQLRNTWASVCLYRVHPLLRRCLPELQVAHLFSWAA